MQFRKDINALRAIAVLSVVLFHFNHEFLPGGFVGVDVFFVISGFLMTGIIVSKVESGQFNLLVFYKARCKRIIPPLLVLNGLLLVMGGLYLSAFDYQQLSKHSLSSLFFISNVAFWLESGYFDVSSQFKWLLHTWSLSVEWQFYLLYPVFILVVAKLLGLKYIKSTIIISAIVAFFFSIYITQKWPAASYYLLPSRAWEMLAGGIAFLYPLGISKKNKALLGVFSVGLILSSFILMNENILWPSWYALVPVVGTFFLLSINFNNSNYFNFLPFQYIGKWSYSIYLWHWPLVVLNSYLQIDFWWLIAIPASIILGAISYHYVEYRKMTLPSLQIVFLFVCVVATSVYLTKGAIFRFEVSQHQKHLSVLEAHDDWDYPSSGNYKLGNNDIVFLDKNSNKNILFIGASHIEQLYPFVKQYSNYNVYFLTKLGCMATPSFPQNQWSCDNIQSYKNILNEIKFEKIVTSFYLFDSLLPKGEPERSQMLGRRVNEYNIFLNELKGNSDSVFLILGEPKGKEFNPVTSIRYGLPTEVETQNIRKLYTVHYQSLKQLTELDGVKVIDPIDYLCDDVCQVADKDGNYFYKDNNHMRPWYTIHYLDFLKPIVM